MLLPTNTNTAVIALPSFVCGTKLPKLIIKCICVYIYVLSTEKKKERKKGLLIYPIVVRTVKTKNKEPSQVQKFFGGIATCLYFCMLCLTFFGT